MPRRSLIPDRRRHRRSARRLQRRGLRRKSRTKASFRHRRPTATSSCSTSQRACTASGRHTPQRRAYACTSCSALSRPRVGRKASELNPNGAVRSESDAVQRNTSCADRSGQASCSGSSAHDASPARVHWADYFERAPRATDDFEAAVAERPHERCVWKKGAVRLIAMPQPPRANYDRLRFPRIPLPSENGLRIPLSTFAIRFARFSTKTSY